MGLEQIDPCVGLTSEFMACADALWYLEQGGTLTEAVRRYQESLDLSNHFFGSLTGFMAVAVA
jgi:hypothetical protein